MRLTPQYAVPHKSVDLACPDQQSGQGLPLWATCACQSLPLGSCLPCERPYRLRVLWTDPTPCPPSALLLGVSVRPTCLPVEANTYVLVQERSGPPKSLLLLYTRPTLLVDPGGPSRHSPYGCPHPRCLHPRAPSVLASVSLTTSPSASEASLPPNP